MYKDTRKKIYEELGEEVSGEALHIAFKDKGEKQVWKENWLKNDSETAILIREIGGNGFYFKCYKNVLELDIPKQYLFRYTYLCTYLDYDGKLKIMVNGKKKAITERDLQEILKLSEREARNTKNELIKYGLIIINEDGTISINSKYAIKGEVKRKKLRGGARIMINGIREIYEKSKPIEHKRLALLIQLLPYVNYNYNIICFNPDEEDKDKIIPMGLKDLCKITDYNERNWRKLKNELLRITVGGTPVIAVTEIYNGHAVSINPKIYYKGNNPRALEWLAVLFNILGKK